MAKLLLSKLLVFTITTLVAAGSYQAWAVTVKEHKWAKTVNSGHNDRTTTLQFYFHDTLSGKSPTAVQVAQPSKTHLKPSGFGVLVMADDPLTLSPDPRSKLVGRAQGLYGSACQDELGLVMAMSYSFIDGVYNGSSISILGRNSIMQPVREMPVVGGTGVFRMARGYALARTHVLNLNTGNAIVGYNVTVVH